jgi:hypothetical protein
VLAVLVLALLLHSHIIPYKSEFFPLHLSCYLSVFASLILCPIPFLFHYVTMPLHILSLSSMSPPSGLRLPFIFAPPVCWQALGLLGCEGVGAENATPNPFSLPPTSPRVCRRLSIECKFITIRHIEVSPGR